jgi:hypothetical protein
LQSRNLHSKEKKRRGLARMDADWDLKDPRSSAFIRGAFAFYLFSSRLAGKGRSRIGQGGTAKANSAHACDVPSRFLAVTPPVSTCADFELCSPPAEPRQPKER